MTRSSTPSRRCVTRSMTAAAHATMTAAAATAAATAKAGRAAVVAQNAYGLRSVPRQSGSRALTMCTIARTIARNLVRNALSIQSNVPCGWGPRLRRGVFESHDARCIVYAISPFLFSLAGMYQYVNAFLLRDHLCAWWPWETEAMLVILQGLLSFLSDVFTLGAPSVWHVADRVLAPILTTWFIARTVVQLAVFPLASRLEHAFFCVIFPVVFYVFSRSHRAFKGKNFYAYLKWHSVWHALFPLFGVSYVALNVACECGVGVGDVAAESIRRLLTYFGRLDVVRVPDVVVVPAAGFLVAGVGK